jgi:hypothetical protein
VIDESDWPDEKRGFNLRRRKRKRKGGLKNRGSRRDTVEKR